MTSAASGPVSGFLFAPALVAVTPHGPGLHPSCAPLSEESMLRTFLSQSDGRLYT